VIVREPKRRIYLGDDGDPQIIDIKTGEVS